MATRGPPPSGRSIVAYTSTYPDARYTVFTSLTVKPVRKGDRLTLSCKGAGCPLKSKTVKVKKKAKQRSLLTYLKGAKLRNGAVLPVARHAQGHRRPGRHLEDPGGQAAEGLAHVRTTGREEAQPLPPALTISSGRASSCPAAGSATC